MEEMKNNHFRLEIRPNFYSLRIPIGQKIAERKELSILEDGLDLYGQSFEMEVPIK